MPKKEETDSDESDSSEEEEEDEESESSGSESSEKSEPPKYTISSRGRLRKISDKVRALLKKD